MTSAGIDWQREKWQSGLGSKFIHQGEKNAAKYADEVIVLSKGVQDYFKETYGRETHFIPNGVNRPQIREASLITDKFGLKKDSYILFLGRLVPEKGIRYLVEAFKNNEYCVSKTNPDGSIDSYNYQKRNQSTAHVHMMLNGALMKMMDSTECLIFLDTPNSLKAKDVSNGTTNSGWIYSELLMSKLLRRLDPIRKSMNFALNESVRHDGLSVEYDADITHLIIISLNDIIHATRDGKYLGKGVLDYLYFDKGLCKEN